MLPANGLGRELRKPCNIGYGDMHRREQSARVCCMGSATGLLITIFRPIHPMRFSPMQFLRRSVAPMSMPRRTPPTPCLFPMLCSKQAGWQR